jgi:hypothetical protein
MAQAYALAAELARPVARGHLTLTDADAELLLTAFGLHRNGSPYDPLDVFSGLQHILRLHLERLEVARDLAAMRIRSRLRPLLALRKPSNVLLAEAHDVNGAAGFPFDEETVTAMATTEMYWAMPARQGGGRHAR